MLFSANARISAGTSKPGLPFVAMTILLSTRRPPPTLPKIYV
jgi:hypothetical protein